MAEFGNPLSAAFWAGTPSDSPLSYEALQTRRKIAEQLMGKRSPFPKTFGEGLTYAGERFADVMDMNRLDAAEKQQAAYEKNVLSGGPPLPGSENTAVAPAAGRADAGTDATSPAQTAQAPYSAPGAAPGNTPLPPPRPARLRDNQLAQLQEDPALLRRAAAMTLGEVDRGTSPAERQTQFASLLDRAGARDIPVAQALETYTGPGSRGYYPPDAFARGEKLLQKPGAYEAFQRDIATPVLRGADPGAAALGFTPTGNASGGVAQRGVASGRYNVAGQFPGSAETYVQQESPTQLARLEAGRNRIAAAASPPVQTAALTTPGVASDASPAASAVQAVAALPTQQSAPAQAPPLIPGSGPAIPTDINPMPTQVAQNVAGRAVPPPIAPRDPGPQPVMPPPTPEMRRARDIANNRMLNPDTRAQYQAQYNEMLKTQREVFVNDLKAHHEDVRKFNDPATGLTLRGTQLTNEQLQRKMEGEGWVPISKERLATLPKPAEGQVIYEDRAGALHFGPAPPASPAESGAQVLQKKMAEHFVSHVEAGATAADDLQMLSQMRALAAKVNTGPEAIAKQFAGRLGIKTEGVSNIEALNSIISRLVPQQRVPGSGTASDFDAHLFQGSLPQLMNTPTGNNMIMDTMEGVAKNKLARAEIGGKVVSGELSIPDGTKELLKLQAQARAMSDQVKAFVEATGGAISAPPPAEAIKELRASPTKARQFDEVFGPGASKRYLGQ